MTGSNEAETINAGSTIDEASTLLNLDLAPQQIDLLTRYRGMLLEANRHLNLTALRDPGSVDSRLIAESLALAPLIGQEPQQVIDVGTGGGIPGIPLAIALPQSSFCLLDATAKKLNAIEAIVSALELSNVALVHGRAEEAAHETDHRGCYTVVISRAVARLATLVEYTLPFLEAGGIALLPKGQRVQREIREAKNAIDTLGGEFVDLFTSPVNDAQIVQIRQRRPSPRKYPRSPGTPARQPIGVSTR